MGTRYFVEADWWEVLCEGGEGKVWIGRRAAGAEKSEFGEAVLSRGQLSASLQGLRLSLRPDGALRFAEGQAAVDFVPPKDVYRKLHSKALGAMAVSPAGGLGASSDGSDVTVWDHTTRKKVRELSGQLLSVDALAFFPSGSVLLVGGGDCRLRVHSVETGAVARELVGHTQRITGVAFVGRGKEVLSASWDGTARLWSCASGATLRTWAPEKGPLSALALAGAEELEAAAEGGPGAVLALASDCGWLSLWRLSDGSECWSLNLKSPVRCVELLPRRGLAAAGTEGGDLVWASVETGQVVGRQSFGRGPLRCVALVGEEAGLAAGFGDGSLLLLRIDGGTAEAAAELSGPDAGDAVLALATNKTSLFTASRDGAIRRYFLLLLQQRLSQNDS